MSTQKTPRHFIIASNLIFIAFALSFVFMFLPNIRMMAGMLPVFIATKVMILAIAILLRLGYSWSKYLLAALAVFTVIGGVHDAQDIFIFPTVSAILNVVQIALVVWATIVVFKPRQH